MTRITDSTQAVARRSRCADDESGRGEARTIPIGIFPIAVRQQWRGAMECNGNGLCFNFDARNSDVFVDEDHPEPDSFTERARNAGA
ncbi:hypothetical protein ACLB1Q_03950 [Escherichia coli]